MLGRTEEGKGGLRIGKSAPQRWQSAGDTYCLLRRIKNKWTKNGRLIDGRKIKTKGPHPKSFLKLQTGVDSRGADRRKKPVHEQTMENFIQRKKKPPGSQESKGKKIIGPVGKCTGPC